MKTKVCVLLKSALRVLRRFYFLIPALAAIILYKVLPHLPRFTETVFSRFLFRIISFPIAIITSLIPISITELSLLLIPISMMVLLVFFIILMIRSESRLKTAGRAARAVGWVMSFTLLLYMLLHGANYYRLPVSTLMHLDMSPKSADLLQSFCIDLAKSASSERATLKEDENGNTVLSNGLLKTLAQAGDGYKILDNRYPFLWGSVNRTKPAQLSYKWSYTGISGMYFPFFVEANVNIDQPDSAIPATSAHELAHTRGFAREDECNFFACLSCFVNPSPDYRYSGYLMAYIFCSNALYSYDADMWAETRTYCTDGVIRDIEARTEYWDSFKGEVQKISNRVNDNFIQSQGVDDGVLSYDRVVRLLLAYYEKEGLY